MMGWVRSRNQARRQSMSTIMNEVCKKLLKYHKTPMFGLIILKQIL